MAIRVGGSGSDAPRLSATFRVIGVVAIGSCLVFSALIAIVLVKQWDTEKFLLYAPKLVSGFVLTVTLVGQALLIGGVLSVPIVALRTSNNIVLYGIGALYIWFFRGSPLIAQLFLIYYGAGQYHVDLRSIGLWGFFGSPWYCALLAFALNTAAYQAEIFRGAIQSVPRGQVEAAKALGLSRIIIFSKIVFPQALIVALRPYGNEIVLTIKASAVVSIVTIFDLMGETKSAFSKTFDYTIYLWSAIIYLLAVEMIRIGWFYLERRFTRHLTY